MSENIVTLLCLLYGESTDHSFEVEISKNASISKLRKEIWEEIQPCFGGLKVTAKDLILWSVSIPIDNKDVSTTLQLEENEEKKIRKLIVSDKVATEFPEELLYPRHVHILVQCPKIHIHDKVKNDDKEIVGLAEKLDTLNISTSTLNITSYEDEFVCISEARLARFDEALSKVNVCLLCSPPASGKTTLSAILKEYLNIERLR